MKILFSMRHAGALRNFGSTVDELSRRGHQVHLVFMTRDKLNDPRLLQDLQRQHSRLTASDTWNRPPRRAWAGVVKAVRSTADYARYRTPEFAAADALRARAARLASPLARAVVDLPGVRSRAGLARLTRALNAIDRAVPADPFVVDLVRAQAPDALLVTPLVELGSEQVEYLKAARQLGIPSALLVHSWDNLTNKGLIHARPDRVFVWNEAQRHEAVAMHGIPAAQVVATGAPVYDQWFARRPGTTREEFCRRAGLPDDRPFLLYLCSSQFIAPHEAAFVTRWIAAVRAAADPRVRDAGIVIRFHPRTELKQWKRFDRTAFPGAVIWPSEPANPVDPASKSDYFDSLYHAAAAVGVNTSAQIEAGIVGRPVFSIRVPEYQKTQEGTLHFHHLLRDSGGLLHLADTLEAHVAALAGAFDRRPEDAQRLRRFVEGFVRPLGLDVPATAVLADAIEQLAPRARAAGQATAERIEQTA